MKLRTLAVVGALGVGGVMVATGGDDPASVVRVIDGDTFVASVDGEEKNVRLLNVDTPEIGRNGEDSECLAEQAKDYLSGVLTPGTEVELRYDVERNDRYGRELAAVYLSDQFINADIAREGFGVAVTFEPNDKYYWDVHRAQGEAEAASLGVHEPDLECAASTEVETAATDAAALTAVAAAGMSVYGLERHAGAVESLLNDVRHLLTRVSDPSGFAKAAFDGYSKEKEDTERVLRQLENELEDTRKLIDAEEKKAEEQKQREEERQQKEEQRKKAAAAEESERSRSEVRPPSPQPERRSAAISPTTAIPAPAPPPAPAAKPSVSGGYDGYTGCRAYAGNYALTSVDDKGRPYAKIDCTTKAQIG